jgi:hypothetical protein
MSSPPCLSQQRFGFEQRFGGLSHRLFSVPTYAVAFALMFVAINQQASVEEPFLRHDAVSPWVQAGAQSVSLPRRLSETRGREGHRIRPQKSAPQ